MTDAMTSEIDHGAIAGDGHDKATSVGQTCSQYVTFTVDERSYGIEITKVREIKGWSKLTELPSSQHAMCGVLNLRGVILPVFDLRARFGRGATQPSEEHVVIIVTLGDRLVGILVDAVSDILTLELGEVLPVPEMDTSVSQQFLAGLVTKDDRMVALLKLEELFEIGDQTSDQAI